MVCHCLLRHLLQVYLLRQVVGRVLVGEGNVREREVLVGEGILSLSLSLSLLVGEGNVFMFGRAGDA